MIEIERLRRRVAKLEEQVALLQPLVHDMQVADKRRENARKARVAKYIKQGLSPEEAEARA